MYTPHAVCGIALPLHPYQLLGVYRLMVSAKVSCLYVAYIQDHIRSGKALQAIATAVIVSTVWAVRVDILHEWYTLRHSPVGTRQARQLAPSTDWPEAIDISLRSCTEADVFANHNVACASGTFRLGYACPYALVFAGYAALFGRLYDLPCPGALFVVGPPSSAALVSDTPTQSRPMRDGKHIRHLQLLLFRGSRRAGRPKQLARFGAL